MKIRILLTLPLAVALSGCWVSLTNSLDIALYQSDLQRLIVTNTTMEPLTIAGPSGGAPTTLAPGHAMTVPFLVSTIGTATPPSGEPYWTLAPGGYTETFVETQSPKVIDTSSTALALNFHDPRGTLVKASFSLASCPAGVSWAQQHVPAADHPIRVPDPVPAVPQAVCP